MKQMTFDESRAFRDTMNQIMLTEEEVRDAGIRLLQEYEAGDILDNMPSVIEAIRRLKTTGQAGRAIRPNQSFSSLRGTWLPYPLI